MDGVGGVLQPLGLGGNPHFSSRLGVAIGLASGRVPDPSWRTSTGRIECGGSRLAVNLDDKWALAIPVSNDDRFDRLVIRHDLAVDD